MLRPEVLISNIQHVMSVYMFSLLIDLSTDSDSDQILTC